MLEQIRAALKWADGRRPGEISAFPDPLIKTHSDGLEQETDQSSGDVKPIEDFDSLYAGSLGVRVPGVISISKEDLPTSDKKVDNIIKNGLQSGKTIYLIDKVYNQTIYQRTICLFDAQDESMVEHLKHQGRLIILPYSVEYSLNGASLF